MQLLPLQVVAATDTTDQAVSAIGLISDIGVVGIVILVLLFLLSAVTIYLFVERFGAIRRAASFDDDFMNRIKDFVANGNMAGARDLCARTDTPVSRMIDKGVQRIGKPLKDINASIENQGNLEIYHLERGLNILATISGAAPMLGFLGTVTGMITAFRDVAEGRTAAADLTGGIYEAMFTTAAGLAVGILAYVAYNLLTNMVEKAVFRMEASSVDFIDLLQEPSK